MFKRNQEKVVGFLKWVALIGLTWMLADAEERGQKRETEPIKRHCSGQWRKCSLPNCRLIIERELGFRLRSLFHLRPL
ncbi:hypothetical protein CEXT_284031 [Caerostris extrusa]|uniref:Secreted protein n=1 Tax=Caerostris extrusa TaxID=172846 RepID=A0AAV4U519_CAEEX|nr:hypothetical protein CEXT_284031 [Caerostris extrusa]